MIITLLPEQKNSTPKVIEALKAIKAAGGGELNFEKGEYHFYDDNSYSQFVAVSNNCSNIKKIIFPLIEQDNLTINGNGSVFVFHNITTPFYVDKCSDLVIKNIIFDRPFSPAINMKLKEKTDEGIFLEIDKEKVPYSIKNGNIIFEREWGKISSADKKLSMHLKGKHLVQYLFVGDCADSTENLPVSFMYTDATEVEGGIFLKYRENIGSKCIYVVGADLYTVADGSERESDVLILNDSKDIKIENVTIRRGLGMGVIGQLCSNVEISGLKTDSAFYNESTTLTADCMHFVNCTGNIDIHDCDIEYISDDAINIHGIYTQIKEKADNILEVELKHPSQRYINLYREGDVLDIINPKNCDKVAEFAVTSAEIADDKGSIVKIQGEFLNYNLDVESGFLVENTKRMPNVKIYNNEFRFFPCIRLSGGGRIIVNDNKMYNCTFGLLVDDLIGYWSESGRVKDLLFKGNEVVNSYMGCFIKTAISDSVEGSKIKIHDRIEISDNYLADFYDKAIKSVGVKNLIIKNNSYSPNNEDIVWVDGKNVPER